MAFMIKAQPEMDALKDPTENAVIAPAILKEADPEQSNTGGVVRRDIGEESNDVDSLDVSRRKKALLLQRKTILTQMMGR